MTPKTHAFITNLFEYYEETASGREPDNAKALLDAWREIDALATAKARTLVVEIEGGICQNVHGLPTGWDYQVADWDDADGDAERVKDNQHIIKEAQALNK